MRKIKVISYDLPLLAAVGMLLQQEDGGKHGLLKAVYFTLFRGRMDWATLNLAILRHMIAVTVVVHILHS